jgi:hypothetical protein
MRTSATLAALTLAIVACHEAPTEAFLRPSGPAPSGLPVVLSITPSTATPFDDPAIVADGDSLTAAAEYDVSGCLDYSVAAGTVGGSVIVTIIESAPPAARYCSMVKASAIFRAVVRPAPRGNYPVVLRQRLEWTTDGPFERERARGSITLP